MNARPLAKAALALAATLLALGVAEVGMRLADVELNTNPRLRYHPDLGWTLNPVFRRHDEINADGFRHRTAREKPPGSRRLVILGDSFSFAGAYPYARTYAGLLEEWLNLGGRGGAGGERWEVVNLGVSGYGTAQQLLALRLYGLSFEPDAVVLQMFPYNDLCNNNLRQAFTCSFLDFHRPYFVLDGEGLRLTYLHPVRARLRRLSRLFGWVEVRTGWGLPKPELGAKGKPRRAEYLAERARSQAGLAFESNRYSLAGEADQPQAIRTAWEVTERLVGEIAAAVEAEGAPLIGVVIPFYDTLRPGWSGLRPRGGPPLVADHATREAERMLAENGARVISMRRRVLAGERAPKDYFFPRRKRPDKHLNDFGHFMVATWLLEELRALGLTAATALPPASLAASDAR